MTKQADAAPRGRTAAATAAAAAARKRRTEDAMAAKLAAAGWVCFPPEKKHLLRAFLDAHQGDACPPAEGAQG